jgi:hypothetical protein
MVVKMSDAFVRLAPYLKDPLILSGFFVFISFLVIRVVIQRVPVLQRTSGYRIVRLMLVLGFVIGLLIVLSGYALKRQQLLNEQQATQQIESMLRDVLRFAPGSDEKKNVLVQAMVEAYRSGAITREQIDKTVQNIKISLTQDNTYVPQYRATNNEPNTTWRGRGDNNLPDVKTKLQAHTTSPVLTSTVGSSGFESQPQPSDGLQRIPSPGVVPILIEQRAPSLVLQKDQSVDVSCLICGCKGGETSQDLITKAWDALNGNKGGMDPKKFEKALACAKVTITRFAGEADKQQAARLQTGDCKKTPTKEERDAYFSSNWALSDVAAAWFIRGQVLAQQRNCKEAKETYQTIIAKYNCAYIWDPRGWFWNVANGTDQELKNLETISCK